MLEGQYTLEGPGDACPYRKYDIEVRKNEGRLVDECCLLQQRKDQERSNCWQNCMQEKLGKAD